MRSSRKLLLHLNVQKYVNLDSLFTLCKSVKQHRVSTWSYFKRRMSEVMKISTHIKIISKKTYVIKSFCHHADIWSSILLFLFVPCLSKKFTKRIKVKVRGMEQRSWIFFYYLTFLFTVVCRQGTNKLYYLSSVFDKH